MTSSRLVVCARRLALLSAIFGVGPSGCNEAVGYSAPVGINLKAKGDDLRAGVIVDEKSITTESGNPYGAFVTEARRSLGGKDPGRIEIASSTLLLGGTSRGVTTLEQVLGGLTTVQFVMNDTNNSFNAAYVDGPRGVGPVPLAVDFNPAITGEDWNKLLKGNFRVVLRGPAAAGFAGNKELQADLQVTFEFAAYP